MTDRMDMPLLRRLKGARQLARVRLADIDPNPRQPRRAFPKASIDALAESIRRYGLLEPLIVRRGAEGRFAPRFRRGGVHEPDIRIGRAGGGAGETGLGGVRRERGQEPLLLGPGGGPGEEGDVAFLSRLARKPGPVDRGGEEPWRGAGLEAFHV